VNVLELDYKNDVSEVLSRSVHIPLHNEVSLGYKCPLWLKYVSGHRELVEDEHGYVLLI
jgi:hypothetical protein